jgi:putative peptidoglycan lipid II flippase
MAGAAALIAAITLLSRVVGFGRWMAQSYGVGASATGTAYATANTLPNVLFEVVAGGALAGAVVPLLAAPLARGLRADVDRIASALLTWAVALLVPTAVLLTVLARPIVGLLYQPGPAVDPVVASQTVDLAVSLVAVFAPQVVLYGIGVVLTGVLQAHRRFGWPAAAPLASSAVVIVSYLAFHRLAVGSDRAFPGELPSTAVAWLGWGTTAGVAAMSLPLIIPVLRSGVQLRPSFRFPPGVGSRARNLAFAGLGGLVAQQFAVLVTTKLANDNGGSGAINLFLYSQAVYFLPYAVLAVPLATAAFPRLAEHAATGDRQRYANLVSVSTRAVLAVSLLGAAVLVAVAPAVAAFFATIDASHDPSLVTQMGPTLTMLAPGLLGYALIFQLSRVLFALERGRAAVSAVATGWFAVAVASVVGVRLAAPSSGDAAGTLRGLAAGNSIGMLVAGAALLVAVRRASGPDALGGIVRTMSVGLLGAVGAAGAGLWTEHRLQGAWGTGAASSAAVGLLAALVAVLVMGAVLLTGDRPLARAVRRRGHPVDERPLQEEAAGG